MVHGLKRGYAVNGRVFEAQFLIGMNVPEGALAHERGFVETAQDQLQLAGIRIDITNGVNTLNVGGIIGCVNMDGRLVDGKPPVGNGSEFWSQAKEGNQVIGSQCRYGFVFGRNADLL